LDNYHYQNSHAHAYQDIHIDCDFIPNTHTDGYKNAHAHTEPDCNRNTVKDTDSNVYSYAIANVYVNSITNNDSKPNTHLADYRGV
jgi:hypothetical protein